ncbi:hypothetical protein CLI64_13810 [Nostoc sp. CENA543]|uniref:DUF6263 family protein n=1 Tax=Nostoc sp. CENA543 TaxID=1869241 RepID=UPI000CA0F3DF|nr:DUF6263 family protein [Nostoc sp. CENA543]AUT01386.1 hypothetical protein CLI64_13810 [Nostoc sp. CENA543]
MKKTFFVSGMMFLAFGWGFSPSLTSVKAETFSELKQVIKNETNTISAAKKTQLELLNSGTGTKQKLRFQPPLNLQETAIVRMKMNMNISIGGQASPSFKQPEIVTTLQTKVTQIDPNGDIHYEFYYSDVDLVGDTDIPPAALNNLKSQLQKLVGFKGSAIVDPQGKTKKLNFVLPEGVDANLKLLMQQMSNSLEQLSLQIPQQAVGVGSHWRVTSNINAGGMNFQQITTYKLINLEKGIANFNIAVEQIAPPSQNLTTPGLPAGVTLNLKSYQGKGQGEMTVALNKLMPVTSRMSLLTDMQISQKQVGRVAETAINQKISIDMNLESK